MAQAPPKAQKNLENDHRNDHKTTQREAKPLENDVPTDAIPMPIYIFVHLVPPPLFSLWYLIFGGDPSGEDGPVAGTGARRH